MAEPAIPCARSPGITNKWVPAYQARTPVLLEKIIRNLGNSNLWALTRVLAFQASPSSFTLAPCRAHLPGALRIRPRLNIPGITAFGVR